MKTRKRLRMMVLLLAMLLLCACGEGGDTITVISREEGSGTRGAFVELVGIETQELDRTTMKAEISSSTAVVLQTVAGNPNAIGYVSLGAVSDSVKVLSIDGVVPSVESIGTGSYPIARPFYVATMENVGPGTRDFLNYILSEEGQRTITEFGFVSVGRGEAFSSALPKGEVVVAGSSSVAPVMEKLAEAYMSVNPGLRVKLQTSDSSTGMESVRQGISDIGMASRELKESELAKGLIGTKICMDGIAVIVHPSNPRANLTTAQLCNIYIGNLTRWSMLEG